MFDINISNTVKSYKEKYERALKTGMAVNKCKQEFCNVLINTSDAMIKTAEDYGKLEEELNDSNRRAYEAEKAMNEANAKIAELEKRVESLQSMVDKMGKHKR